MNQVPESVPWHLKLWEYLKRTWEYLKRTGGGWVCFSLGFVLAFVFLSLWNLLEGPNSIPLFVSVATILVAFGLILYYILIYRNLTDKGTFFQNIPRVIAHVADTGVSARHHIWAGVALFSGLSLLSGAIFSSLFSSKPEWHSYVATSSGLMLGIFTLGLSFWTLWMTKRIERQQGERIDRFDSLIITLTKEIGDLIDRYTSSNDRSSDLFRVCLVTNNPYFGVITYPDGDVTLNFNSVFVRLAKFVQRHRQAKAGLAEHKGFRLRIVCANAEYLASFNAQYFNLENEKVGKETADRKSETFIREICEHVGTACFTRLPLHLPDVQFIIVGNVVYEFLLEAPEEQTRDRGTNIRHTRRIEDQALADRYERNMRFFESLAHTQSIDPIPTPEEPAVPQVIISPPPPGG